MSSPGPASRLWCASVRARCWAPYQRPNFTCLGLAQSCPVANLFPPERPLDGSGGLTHPVLGPQIRPWVFSSPASLLRLTYAELGLCSLSLGIKFQQVSGVEDVVPATPWVWNCLSLDVCSPCAPRKLMDKQTFCSSQSTSNTARYAAALYRQGTRAGQPGCRGSWRPLGWEGSRRGAGTGGGCP